MSGSSPAQRSTPSSSPATNHRVPQPWALEVAQVLATLGSDHTRGLSPEEATRRLQSHGPNVLRSIGSRKAWAIFAEQFRSILVGLLALALVVAVAFAEWVQAGAIGVVLVVNALVGFVTEFKATRSMEALRKLGMAQATVRRGGQPMVVPAAELVPGDIVVVEGGDLITADLRLCEGSKLQANEATLTGESMPKGKSVGPVAPDTPVGDRDCMLFKGTVVTRGSGVAVVVATGADSELGQISSLVETAREETTPLERRLNRLGHGLAGVTFVVAGLVAVSGYLAGQPLFLIMETAIALAVAAVPEGLPVIATIALARGMHRMAARNALINRLSAVETLGATSILCIDKTGTLTENRMEVAEIRATDEPNARRRALEVGVLCNNAALGEDSDGVGDPLEVALLAAGLREGVDPSELLAAAPEVHEHAFDPDLKMMATVHAQGEGYRVAVKGAPEAVLKVSTLDAAGQQLWLAESERLGAQGLRVLAMAERDVPDPPADPYTALTFLGLMALRDPPRPGVHAAISACRRAGLRIVMVTGDHPVTARNIALATGLTERTDEPVLLGADLDGARNLAPAERQRLVDATIYARVSPRHKLELIALHQAAGAVVAMTGDGVNDAPALRKADIGIAMGKRGTGAAREAAAMVLKDDDLSTIPVAAAEGRAIFANIRKFVVYLLSCNMSEVLVVALAAGVSAPLPLLPLQILFLNLVTDVFPALALGVGEAGPGVMDRKPRPAGEAILTTPHWWAIAGYGLLLTASVLAAFATVLHWDDAAPTEAVTASFLTLALGQLWHVFNMRHRSSPGLRNEVTRNPWIWAAVGLCILILLGALFIPPLARILSLAPPAPTTWLLILGMSAVPLAVGQGVMALGRRRHRGAPRAAQPPQ